MKGINPDYPPFDKVESPPFKMAHFTKRENFATYLLAKQLHGTMIEVGVHRGEFANLLLSKWECQSYIGIDPYYESYGDDRITGSRVRDKAAADEVLNKFSFTRNIWFYNWLNSVEAADLLRHRWEKGIDFIYLDGDHTLIRQDLELWWPFLRKGGLLAGHDLDFPRGEHEKHGDGYRWRKFVEPALRDFSKDNGNLTVYVVKEPGHPWSWYMEKP